MTTFEIHAQIRIQTEDPEYEMDPCRRLAKLGETACKDVSAVRKRALSRSCIFFTHSRNAVGACIADALHCSSSLDARLSARLPRPGLLPTRAPSKQPQGWGVPAFEEETRDTHTFSRRVGALPVQQEGDAFDYRPLLHRCARAIASCKLPQQQAVAACGAQRLAAACIKPCCGLLHACPAAHATPGACTSLRCLPPALQPSADGTAHP